MLCNWGEKEFKESGKELKKMIASEKDIEKKIYLESVYNDYLHEYQSLFGKDPDYKFSLNQLLFQIQDDVVSYGRAYSIVNKLLSSTESIYDQIDDMSDRFQLEKNYDRLTKATYGIPKKTIDFIHDFYLNFDSTLYPFFLEVFNDREHSLRFVNRINRENVCGETIFFDGIRKSYISILRSDEINLYETGVHEYGHAISYLVNPRFNTQFATNLFSEFPSIFPEIVALYENRPNFPKSRVAYEKWLSCQNYLDTAFILNEHIPIANEIKKHNFSLNDSFFKDLKKNHHFTRRFLNDVTEVSIIENGAYVLSFIASLELLHIYRNNKKEALELYKHILMCPLGKDIMAHVLQVLPLNKYASEEIGIVVDEFDGILKKSGI